jgi:hypothetical protein
MTWRCKMERIHLSCLTCTHSMHWCVITHNGLCFNAVLSELNFNRSTALYICWNTFLYIVDVLCTYWVQFVCVWQHCIITACLHEEEHKEQILLI